MPNAAPKQKMAKRLRKPEVDGWVAPSVELHGGSCGGGGGGSGGCSGEGGGGDSGDGGGCGDGGGGGRGDGGSSGEGGDSGHGDDGGGGGGGGGGGSGGGGAGSSHLQQLRELDRMAKLGPAPAAHAMATVRKSFSIGARPPEPLPPSEAVLLRLTRS